MKVFWWVMTAITLVTHIASLVLLPTDYSRDTYQFVVLLFFCYQLKTCEERK